MPALVTSEGLTVPVTTAHGNPDRKGNKCDTWELGTFPK